MFIFETAKGFRVNLFLAQNFSVFFLAQSGFLVPRAEWFCSRAETQRAQSLRRGLVSF